MSIARNYRTALTSPQQSYRQWLGDSVDDTAGMDAGSDPLLQQLHLLAQAIQVDRQYINAQVNNIADADATVDWDGMTAAAQSIVQLKAQFSAVARQRAAQTQAIANDAVGFLGQVLTDIAGWAQAVLDNLASVLAALPNALVDALGKIASNVGDNLLSASFPFFAVGALAVGFLLFAEKSHTVRRAVG